MIENVNLQHEGLVWLAGQLRWERRFAELRLAASAGTGHVAVPNIAAEVPALAA